MRRFEAQFRDRDLPADAHRVELTGPPRTLAWPGMCPNCGAPAAERIEVRRIFRRGSRHRPWRYIIGPRVAVPFCAACAEQHRRELSPITARELLVRCLLNPLWIAVAGATTFAVISYQPAVVGTRGNPGHWVGVALFGTLVLTAAYGVFAVWDSTKLLRVPPPTDVTRAFEFSDNLNILLGERHVYAIRNSAFAEALAAANRGRLWTDADRKRYGVVTTVATVVVITALIVARLVLLGR